jgi:hypothetical protein
MSRVTVTMISLAAVAILSTTPPFADAHTSRQVSPLLAKELAVLTDQGISPARAWQAVDVQGMLAHAILMEKLSTAMGGNFAGTWFDPATAQMHVGVTSTAGRLAAEQAIERAGLTADATIAPVRSTMEQLLAVQKAWNRKLTPLFDREEAKTGLEPQHNAVAVTLGSGVPVSQRAALEREAAAADVNVFVTVAATPHLGAADGAKECNNFLEILPNADCNPSITAGVEIERPSEATGEGTGTSHKNTTLDGFAIETLVSVLEGDAVSGPGIPAGTVVVAKPTETSVTISEPAEKAETATFKFSTGSICTAGPAAIPMAHKTERVLLTAGHCIWRGHGTGSFWLAYTRAAAKRRIGAAGSYQNGGAAGAGKGDFGEIAIEPPPEGGMQSGNVNAPVFAVTAEWKKNEETRYPVKGERAAEAGNTNCHEGRTSGEWCGLIKAINVTYTSSGTTKEGMVEEEKAIEEAGDSGGPWLFIETNNEVLMEGTDTAKNPVTCKKNVKSSEGSVFFENEKDCLNIKEKREGPGGQWERKLEVFWQPLKTAPLKIPEGSLEKLKLELLTKSNEINKNLPEFLPIATEESPIPFTSSSGKGILQFKGGNKIECASDTNSGKVIGAKTFTVTIDFAGCKVLSIVAAHSLGDGGETILVTAKGELCYLNKAEKKVGVKLTPTGKVHIEAAGNLAVIEGTIISEYKPINTTSTSSELILKQKEGKQEVVKCEGGAEEHLTGSENEGTAKEVGMETTDKVSFEKAAEVMA